MRANPTCQVDAPNSSASLGLQGASESAVENSLVFYTDGPSRKIRQGKPVMENKPV